MSIVAVSLSRSILDKRKLRWAHLGWWILFVLYTAFSIFDIRNQILELFRYENSSGGIFFIYAFINIVENLITWLLALILFRKKSSDWAVILVTTMFISAISVDSFGFWLIEESGLFFTRYTYDSLRIAMPIMNLPVAIFHAIVRLAVFLTFPTGQWISSNAKRLFRLSAVVFVIAELLLTAKQIREILLDRPIDYDSYFSHYFIQRITVIGNIGEVLLYLMFSIIWVLTGYMLYTHYRTMHNSVQRQQIKWIVVFFFWSVFASALFLVFYAPYYIRNLLNPQLVSDEFSTILPWLSLPVNLLNLGLVIAFSLSVFRYRLWDVDILINKALVYGSLTALLATLSLIIIALVNFGIKQWLGEDESSFWGVAISALPVATAFAPLRDLLQKQVDKRFKPEEVDFSNAFIEFTTEAQKKLTITHTLQIVSEQIKKQLNVDFARAYLLRQDDQLHYSESRPISNQLKKLTLDGKSFMQLSEGKVVVDEDGKPFSLLVPLVVPRARVPDFLGVLVLGRRLSGSGYSTDILKSLKKLGEDAGKVIYLKQLTKQYKIKKTL